MILLDGLHPPLMLYYCDSNWCEVNSVPVVITLLAVIMKEFFRGKRISSNRLTGTVRKSGNMKTFASNTSMAALVL